MLINKLSFGSQELEIAYWALKEISAIKKNTNIVKQQRTLNGFPINVYELKKAQQS